MKNLRASVIRLAHENPSMRKALLDIVTACDCESEAPTMGKFEEGVPADPTENMSEEDAKKWKIQNLRNRDNFTAAQKISLRDIPSIHQEWFTRIKKMYADQFKRDIASAVALQDDMEPLFAEISDAYAKAPMTAKVYLRDLRNAETELDAIGALTNFFKKL